LAGQNAVNNLILVTFDIEMYDISSFIHT